MHVAKIEIFPIAPPQREYRDAYNVYTSSPAVITKVSTDDGVVGFGESSALSPEIYGESIGSIAYTIRNILAPRLIGKNPFDIELIHATMDAAAGRASCAKTSLDMALYDIMGKITNQPVYNLLGGKFRQQVLIAFEIGLDTSEQMAKEARRWVDRGLKVVKIKAGSGDLEEDIKRIKAVSDAVGKDIRLRVDPNTRWSVADCIKASPALQQVNLEYLEQPIPAWNYDGMAEIRKRTGLTLEADEGVFTHFDVMEIAKKEAADVINLKIPKIGGLLKGKKMAAVAEAAGLTCMAGAEAEVSYAIAAKLHLAASTPNAVNASDFTELSLLTDWLLEEPIEMNPSGCLDVPNKAGLGVVLKEEKLLRWRVAV